MIRTRAFFFSLFVAMMIAFMGACSSAPISVTLSPSPTAAVDVGGTRTVAATVANSGKGVKWSLSCPGSLSSESPPSGVYVTPAALLNNEQAIVTATSVADPTKSASVQIAVNLDPQISLQTLAGASLASRTANPSC